MPYRPQVPPPADWQEFERLCHLLFSGTSGRTFSFYGRSGQKQHGIDLVSSDPADGGVFAVQCRCKVTQLTAEEIEEAVTAAANHFANLRKLVFATTAPSDTRAVDAAQKIEAGLRQSGREIEIAILHWEDLLVQAGPYPRLMAAFTGTDVVEDRIPLYRKYLADTVYHSEIAGRQQPQDSLFADYVELDIDIDAKNLPAERLATGPLTLVDAVTGFDRICLYVSGPVGSGKSTTCRHLVWSLLQSETGPIPVHLQIKALSYRRLHPFVVAEEEFQSVHGALASGLAQNLESRLGEEEPICVILDGLDEVPAAMRREFITSLNALAAVRRFSIVVFGRSGSGPELSRHFIAAQIRPLSTIAQQAMADRLLGQNARIRMKRLISGRGAQHLTSNPLMLSWLIAAIGDPNAARSEEGRNAFFRGEGGRLLRYALRRLMSDKRSQQRAPRIRAELRLLRQLALALRSTPQDQWIFPFLIAVIEDLKDADDLLSDWGSAQAFLEQIADETNVLAPFDGKEQPWRFLHSAFFDLLSAEGLMTMPPDDRKNAISQIAQKNKVEWRETFALVADLSEDGEKSAFIDLLEAVDKPSFRRALPYLAGIDPVPALRRLTATADWTARSLRAFTSALSINSKDLAPEAAGLLGSIVSDRLTADQLAYVLHTLQWLRQPPSLEEFFMRAGRPMIGAQALDLRSVLLPAGEIRPGSPINEPDRYNDENWGQSEPVPKFQLTSCAITNADYRRFDPAKQLRRWSGLDESEELYHPVVRVNWWESYIFSAWVGGRLPTEREWEYACRAGSSTAFSFGDALSPEMANYRWDRSEMPSQAALALNRTVRSADYPANVWGLHQMHGNIWEWCWGPYDSLSYGAAAAEPEDFAMSEWAQVARGGSWDDPAKGCRSAFRNRFLPDCRFDHLGFRVAFSEGGA